MHTYFDRGGLIPSFGLGAQRMELPLEKLLEERPRFGGVCGSDFNERNNIVAHNDSPNRIKTLKVPSPKRSACRDFVGVTRDKRRSIVLSLPTSEGLCFLRELS